MIAAPQRLLLAIGIAVIACGCRSAIEAGLSEQQANDVVVVLDQHGIHGVKEAESGAGEEATYAVLVAEGDVAAALTVLRAEDLPHDDEPGLHDVFGAGSLVPTATEERARLTAALGGELARTIESIDGVLDARVHVALPEDDGLLLDAPPSRPRASVLIRHRSGPRPYDEAEVRSLVAGAIQGMAPEDVAIVGVEASEAPTAATHLTSIGPIAVARGSSATLRIVLGALLGTNVLLAIALVLSIVRRRRAAAAPDEATTTTTTTTTTTKA